MNDGNGDELQRRSEREAAAGLWPIRRALTVAGFGAVLGLAAVTVVALAILGFPGLTHHKVISIGDLLEVLKLVLGTVAGVGALAALVMNYRKQRLAEAAEVREHQRAGDERVRVFNERFATAAGQLGHTEPAVRLAGVYAMAGLADDWEHGRQTCIDVLCAYLRMPYEADPGSTLPAERLEFSRNQEVRHAIIAIIGGHLRVDARTSWQGYNFNFTGVRFDGGSFDGARFPGGLVSFEDAEFVDDMISFSEVEFCGATVSFRDARFYDGALVYFREAIFSGGEVDFRGAAFVSGDVDFDGVEFSGGSIDFAGALFSGADVHFKALFSGVAVSFRRAKVRGGTVHFEAVFSGGAIDFDGTEFSGGMVKFGGSQFSGSVVDFSQARFSGGKVDFRGAGSWSTPPSGLNIPVPKLPEGLILPTAAAASTSRTPS
ncbi:pentapeptide repeat-containing protein [Actinoallomurus sp. NBC_01490]|uniref:pentapeptide repeat-containing protein n=1 Tax=Actinoallomurus sp. NBC_01490 TaxID=2903557 RepID=UPI002E344392|nr:hypothetical protein [Actinoallomurus sp. NBC_01490]